MAREKGGSHLGLRSLPRRQSLPSLLRLAYSALLALYSLRIPALLGSTRVQEMQQSPYLDSAQPSSLDYGASSFSSSSSPAPSSFPSYELTPSLRSRSPAPLDDPIGVPSSQQPMERERHSGGGGWGSIGSGSAVARRRTPPNRSTTMDDRLPQGPTQGVLTQQWGSPEPLYEQARGGFRRSF